MAERPGGYKCSVCDNMAEAVRRSGVTTREFCNVHGLWEAK